MVESYGSSGGGGGGGRGFERGNRGNGGNGGWNFGGSSDWNLNTIFSNNDISDKTWAHLRRVYTTLLTSTGACAGGMFINSTFFVQGFIMMILFMFLQIYLIAQIANKTHSEQTRIGYLLALAFAMGFMVGPGINQIAAVNP